MILVTYNSQPNEPGCPYTDEVRDDLLDADEFMNTVREHGGVIIEWREMSASEERAHFEGIHQPHGY